MNARSTRSSPQHRPKSATSSVPAPRARCRSASRAVQVRRGSMTTRTASRTRRPRGAWGYSTVCAYAVFEPARSAWSRSSRRAGCSGAERGLVARHRRRHAQARIGCRRRWCRRRRAPAAHRGLSRLQQAGARRRRHQQHRHDSRLCMSSAVAGYKATLGADAPPCAYEDLDHADLVLIAGSNTAYAHPVLYRRLEATRARGGMRVIAIDPRRTVTAREADLHLAVTPGTDVALFHGLLHVLLWEERVDRAFIAAHTEGFEALRTLVRDYAPARVAELCGIAERDLMTAARWFGESRAALSLTARASTSPSPVRRKNAALINLHLATGQIGRPGAGPFSLTGQPNAMGGREVGGLANLLPGHREAADVRTRDEIARLWGIDFLPSSRGRTAVEMFDALKDGVDPRRVDRVHQPRAVAARLVRRPRCTGACGGRRAAGSLCRHRDRALRRRAAAGVDVGREGRDRDQLRAAHLARARRRAAARRGARRLGDRRGLRAAPRRAAAPGAARHVRVRRRRGRVERTPRGDARPRPGHHWADLRAAETRGPQQWPFREGDAAGATRLYADGVFPTPTDARASSPRLRRPGRSRRCAPLHPPHHRAPARPVACDEPHWHGRSALQSCAGAVRRDAS